MRKNKKHFNICKNVTCLLAVLFSVIMILQTSVLVQAADEKSGKCGDNLTWKLDGTTLTISGKGGMYDYDNIDNTGWFQANFTQLIVEEGVTSIGKYAFDCSDKLKIVSLPSSLKTIGVGSFSNCPSLCNINLPDSLTEIPYGTFAQDSSLKNVQLPKNLKKIGGSAFCDSGLTELTIPETVKKLEDMHSATVRI